MQRRAFTALGGIFVALGLSGAALLALGPIGLSVSTVGVLLLIPVGLLKVAGGEGHAGAGLSPTQLIGLGDAMLGGWLVVAAVVRVVAGGRAPFDYAFAAFGALVGLTLLVVGLDWVRGGDLVAPPAG